MQIESVWSIFQKRTGLAIQHATQTVDGCERCSFVALNIVAQLLRGQTSFAR